MNLDWEQTCTTVIGVLRAFHKKLTPLVTVTIFKGDKRNVILEGGASVINANFKGYECNLL